MKPLLRSLNLANKRADSAEQQLLENGWRKKYKAAQTMKRKAQQLCAMPAWADEVEIEKYYSKARELTLKTGIKHQVDHIIPLQGRNVCGLHVEDNLQVITAMENLRKSNRVRENR